MVDETRDGPACSIDDHVLIEIHEIVALLRVSLTLHQAPKRGTNIVLLVDGVHPLIALLLRDNLPGIFGDDLVRLEGAVASDAIPAVGSLDDFDPDIILAAGFPSASQFGEASICAVLFTDAAIGVVAFVKHESVLTIVVTSRLWRADASG